MITKENGEGQWELWIAQFEFAAQRNLGLVLFVELVEEAVFGGVRPNPEMIKIINNCLCLDGILHSESFVDVCLEGFGHKFLGKGPQAFGEEWGVGAIKGLF